jgi:hypothetical protein
MNQPRQALVVAFAFTMMLSAGCGSSSTGGGGGGVGGSNAGGSGGSGGSSACPARPDLIAAAPACDTVVNSAAAIPFTALAGTAPLPAGGTILDGLYESTKTGAYGATTGTGRRITFVIVEGGTRMLWAGEVLDGAGTGVQTSFRANASISVSGTRINVTADCVSTPTSPLPAAFDFTVSDSDLVLSLASGSTTLATTYTRRGCVNSP